MTIHSDTRRASAVSTASSSPPRRNRALRWIGASVLLVVAAAALVVLGGKGPNERATLDPTSASPEGAKALSTILEAEGVSVEIATGKDEARRLLNSEDATLVMSSPLIPSDAAIENARELASNAALTVFVTADEKVLRDFALGEFSESAFDQPVSEPSTGDCRAYDFSGVGEIEAAVLFEPAEGATTCFTNDDGQAALLFAKVSGSSGSAHVAIIEASPLFDNAHLAENGNAALAFALLGNTDRVVWYQPSAADLEVDRAGTLAALTPTWVTPVMLLLVVTAIVAAVWRGRRFGPLVEERLPVTVRASETMHGRARLTAQTGDSAHAAAALRDGAVRRLGKRLGLSQRATPAQIAYAIPHEPALTQLLNGPLPANDAELASFARALGAILDRVDPLPPSEPTTPPVSTSDPTDHPDERPIQ